MATSTDDRSFYYARLPSVSDRYSKWWLDKNTAMRHYVETMLMRTNQMFVYHNMPASIPPNVLELALQTYGCVVIARCGDSEFLPGRVISNHTYVPTDPIPGAGTDVSQLAEKADEATEEVTGSADTTVNDLYFFNATPGGMGDIYYRPTIAVVANPLFKSSHNFTIGKDCALMMNDIFMNGLLPTFYRYAKEYLETDISIISALYNTRIRAILEASQGPEYESAKQFLADIESGKMSAICSRPLIEGFHVWPDSVNGASTLASIIETRQSLQVAWYNELGIDPAFSAKREYVSAEEIGSNTDLLMPLIDHMLVCRKDALDQINGLFGTNITVEKASAWSHKAKIAESNAIAEASELAEQQEKGGEDGGEESNDSSE